MIPIWESGPYDCLPCNLLREDTDTQRQLRRRIPSSIIPPMSVSSGSGGEGSEKSQARGGEINGMVGPKVCSDCQTSKTPLWRSGPAGPKSLCNACGIKYRKMLRRGLGGDHKRKITGSRGWKGGNISTSKRAEAEEATERLKQRQRKKQERMWLLQQSRKFSFSCGKEETEAAVLLMALSSGLFLHY